MNDLDAVGIAEGWIACECEETKTKAWQHLIDTGYVWVLQGWFGRTATQLIKDGICHEYK